MLGRSANAPNTDAARYGPRASTHPSTLASDTRGSGDRDRTCLFLGNSQANHHWFLPGMSSVYGTRTRFASLKGW